MFCGGSTDWYLFSLSFVIIDQYKITIKLKKLKIYYYNNTLINNQGYLCLNPKVITDFSGLMGSKVWKFLFFPEILVLDVGRCVAQTIFALFFIYACDL